MTLSLADQHALIEAHLAAAEQCAKKFVRRGSAQFTYDEFLSAAYRGLVDAARTYDPDHPSGASFATHAYRAMDGTILKMMHEWKRQNGWAQEGGRLKHVVRLKSMSDTHSAGGEDGGSDYELDVPDPNSLVEPPVSPQDVTKVLTLCADSRERRIVLGRLQGLTFRQIAALPDVGVTWQRVHQVWKRFHQRAYTALTLPKGGGELTPY